MFLNVSCNLITPQPFIHPNKPILFFPLSFSFSILTWNTEYYFPKLGDFNALIKANGQTIKSTCESDMLVFLLQEVGAGYLGKFPREHATCGYARMYDREKPIDPDSKYDVFRTVRHGMLEFLKKNCQSDYDISCKDMHGYLGTKTLKKAPLGRKNGQIAVVFNKITNGKKNYNVEIKGKRLSPTEKGGIIVTIKGRGDDTPKAAVIGVHLDSSEEEKRNLQICSIMTDLLKLAGSEKLFFGTGQLRHDTHMWSIGDYKCKKKALDEGEQKCHSNVHKMYALGIMIKELYPLGVYWTGDSNYRLPLETFDLDLPKCPIDDGTDCECRENLIGKKLKKKKHCEAGKPKVIRKLAKLGCGDQDTLDKFMLNDQKSLGKSALTFMGATVNQPYPKFPPRYVFLVCTIYMSLVKVIDCF